MAGNRILKWRLLSCRFPRRHTLFLSWSRLRFKNEIAFTTAYAASLPLITRLLIQIYYLITSFFSLVRSAFDSYGSLHTHLAEVIRSENVTEERDKSSEQEKRRVIMRSISIAVVFAAHVTHSMTYFRSIMFIQKFWWRLNGCFIAWIRPC